jgi:hypothetical protein
MAALAFVACRPEVGADLGPGVVAVVDGEAITSADLRDAYWHGPADLRARASRRGGRHHLLDVVIDERLLLREARSRGLLPRYSLVMSFHQELMARFLDAELSPTVRPEDISEEAVRAEYDRLAPELAVPHRRRVRVLAHDTRESALEMIATVHALIARSGAEGVARGIEDGTLRARYGQDGLYNRESAAAELGEDVAVAAFSLDPAAMVVAEPVRYRGRWGVVIVREDFEARPAPPFEEVEAQLRGRLYQEERERALNRLVDSFRNAHRVERNEENAALVPWVAPDAAAPRASDAGAGSPSP